jgi:hypothetical protein
MVSEQLVREFWLRFRGLPARFQTATASFYRLTGFGRLRCREDRFSRQNNPALLPYSRPGGLPKNGPGKF